MNLPLPDISDLSLRQKIGQMLCLGWRGEGCDGVNDHARQIVTDLECGGLIVMGRNLRVENDVADADRLRETVAGLQNLAAIPMLVATDQEGGKVARLRGKPFTAFPPAQIVGDTDDLDLAYRAAYATARELRWVGIDWNFAPIADVSSNPANPVIGDRAFAADTQKTAHFVTAEIRGYTDGGVLTCAKHFPGHGDTSVDSHYDLPLLTHSRTLIESRELVPFRAAIAADVPAIMTAHILFPAFDPSGVPATLSRTILTGLLRETMGFGGSIVTDCLEMRAVADGWGTARAAVLAAIAGADMLMVCHTPALQRATFASLSDAAESGELPIERIDEAVGRIFAAKRRAQLLPVAAPDFAANQIVAEEIVRKSGNAFYGNVETVLGADAPLRIRRN